MSLLELLDKLDIEIISDILPSDVYTILMLSSTSKTVKNAISDINHNGHKVKVCFKQSDYLNLYNLSTNIKNISKKFTINELYIQSYEIETSIFTRTPKEYLDSYDHLKCKNFEFFKNYPNYDISFLDIIFGHCPSLTCLFVTFLNNEYNLLREILNNKYNPLREILKKFESNMLNCKICIKYNKKSCIILGLEDDYEDDYDISLTNFRQLQPIFFEDIITYNIYSKISELIH